ncbi:MAG TPA: hypothetical protein VHE78_01150 [Gemmatimonadaceae bacterium]|nr:hypothetical protein [Gemmatimonadaceae bacterium]
MKARVAALATAAIVLQGCHAGGALTGPGPLAAGGHRVLFIGNSLTYVNDLPGTLAFLASLVGDTIRTMTVAFPDYALQDHLAEGTAAREIAAGGWEYVVLQQGPSSVEENRQNLITYTRLFDTQIRAKGARTALYMVWPQRVNLSTFQRTVDSYALAAQAVNGLLLPAGDAWRTAWAKDSTLQLYAPDGLHPSYLGTYLAALVMYERITGKDAHTLPLRVVAGGAQYTVNQATIRLLQDAAHETNARYAGARVR